MIDVGLAGQELIIDLDADIYGLLDIDLGLDGKVPQTIVHINTTEYWNSKEHFIGERGHLYVYTDHCIVEGQYIPAVKVGDGMSYLIDNPFVSSNQEQLINHINDHAVHISPNERYFWNNKVRCDDTTVLGETLMFTKN